MQIFRKLVCNYNYNGNLPSLAFITMFRYFILQTWIERRFSSRTQPTPLTISAIALLLFMVTYVWQYRLEPNMKNYNNNFCYDKIQCRVAGKTEMRKRIWQYRVENANGIIHACTACVPGVRKKKKINRTVIIW